MTGHFQPGQKLTYRGVARVFGTSDMPVRSAIQRLISLRALVLLPNGSFEVPLLSASAFSDLMDTRIYLEGLATELATPHLDGNNMRSIRHHCESRTRAARAGDIERYLQSNLDFKFAIYRRCGNRHLLFLIETLWLHCGPFMQKFVEGLEKSLAETLDVDHLHKVVAALEIKDAKRARANIEADINSAKTYLLSHVTFPVR